MLHPLKVESSHLLACTVQKHPAAVKIWSLNRFSFELAKGLVVESIIQSPLLCIITADGAG